MPNVNDILTVAEALEKSAVAVVGDRCVAVRNRNATCRRCVEACPAGAISVSGNEVHLSNAACVGCSACVTACPTEALVSLDPPDRELMEQAAASLAANGDRVVFACARMAARRLADPSTYAQVPCLPRVGEAILLGLAARGANSVLLVDGDCSTCKLGACSAFTSRVADQANLLLAAQGSAARVRRVTGFPDDLMAGDSQQFGGTTRRGFFSEARRSAKETAMTAAKAKVAQELGPQATPEIGERLRVTEDGTLPLIRAARHEEVMNALDRLGRPMSGEIDTTLFGNVTVDGTACNGCGMCVMFCPTGALRRDSAGQRGAPLRYLEFSASDCVQCGLCADVCWKKALSLGSKVDTGQLFDFEPVTFTI